MSVELTRTPLAPFGIVLRVEAGTRWSELDASALHALLAEHRVVVLRGLAPIEKAELPATARTLGPLQSWSFGAVNELVPNADAKNYLYTKRAVPLHWDGAFAGRVPRYLFFHCVEAPADGSGGETVFVDTTRVWAKTDEAGRDRLRALTFRYETAHVAHYGGAFESNVVAQHPHTGETILRFAEPVDDLNPVAVRAKGLGPLESAGVITELRRTLYAEDVLLAHDWQDGDVVIADNHALLHGRRAFATSEKRHIRRVNVHSPERTWRDDLRDSIRIRRPEFMVAEIPILLLPLLLLADMHALAAWQWFEAFLLFFLLFHFGDMINCVSDRDLDAVYKTQLSEAVYGLGVRNVWRQILWTVLAAVVVAGHLASSTGRWDIVPLVLLGLLLGAGYSVPPIRLKGRGVLQVVTLCALIFIGPMVLVARIAGVALSPADVGLFVAYAVMQEGIILVNTAEDLPEDEAAGVSTSAVALGLSNAVSLAGAMVGFGGVALVAALAIRIAAPIGLVGLAPLLVACVWVFDSLNTTWMRGRGRSRDEAMVHVRASARSMPLWITATAWTTLFAALVLATGWGT